ncbi:MAG: nucleoside hydrolase [Fimbriimonas sp.]
MSSQIPVLLDTDPGSDIDDALAIAYLLRQPRCELLGIATVTGDTVQRAGIAEVVCRAFGREDVPIVAGARMPIAHGNGQPHVPHYAAIGDRPHRTDYRPDAAVDFLRETIRARPGEITLLSIGPLTNVALLFAIDPEIPSLLGGFVSMLGSFFHAGRNEWNAICDPAATTGVLKRSRDHTLVGLDVTMQCTLPPDAIRERFANGPQSVILPMATKWFEHADRITFHDPLAAALLFEPDLCTYQRGDVHSPIYGEAHEQMGHTIFSASANGPHEVADTVDVNRFLGHYFEILK